MRFPWRLHGGCMKMRSQFLRHSLRTYVAQMAFTLFQALIAIYIARLLGPESKGVYSLLAVVLMMAVIMGRLGLGHAVIYQCGRRRSLDVVFNGLLLAVGIGLAGGILSLPILFLLRGSLLRGIPRAGLAWAAAMIPLMFVFDYLQSAFIALMQMDHRNLLFLMHPVLQFVLLILSVGLLGWGLAGAFFSLSLAVTMAVVWGLFTLRDEASGTRLRADGPLMRELLRFGLKAHLGGAMEVMNYRADFFLINAFLGPVAVGFFSVAVNLVEVAWRLPEAVVLMLLPRVSRMDFVEAREFTPRVCRMVLFPVLALCLLLLLLGRPLILLFFGSAFQPAAAPLVLLLPGCLAFAVWKVLSGDLVAQGRPMAYSATATLGFGIMILLDLWLIPSHGLAGAAAAFSVTFLTAAVLIIRVYRRVTGNSLADLLIVKKEDVLLLRGMLRRDS